MPIVVYARLVPNGPGIGLLDAWLRTCRRDDSGISIKKRMRALAPMIQRPLRWSGARDLLSSPRKTTIAVFSVLRSEPDDYEGVGWLTLLP